MVYVALLRGINVGGKNKVDMKQLMAAFEDAGMTSVRTYINSGNVIFSSNRLVRTPLYKRMTIRNCNTTRKLLELMEA